MAKPVVVVTGVSGNLGSRLLPLLKSYSVIGVDLNPPRTDTELQFESLDLGQESSTRTFYELLRDTHAYAVIHLAFVIDPVRTGVLDVERMWQINVAGTARVMEAVTEVNRSSDEGIKQFIFPSSVSVYGPDLTSPATEESAFGAHTLPYALHKQESDEVVQQRCTALRGCSVYILRPHIFAGASVENYLMGAFRGTPNGKSARAEKMRTTGKRLPCMVRREDSFQLQPAGASGNRLFAAGRARCLSFSKPGRTSHLPYSQARSLGIHFSGSRERTHNSVSRPRFHNVIQRGKLD